MQTSWLNCIVAGNKKIELDGIDIDNSLKCERAKHCNEFNSWNLMTKDESYKF